jgi:hypothetical protein
MRYEIWRKLPVILIILSLTLAAPDSEAQSQDSPERCKVGDSMSALHAFYPGIFQVDAFEFDENGQILWTNVKGGGLGHGVARCQFRLFAAGVSFLPDSYGFCEHDVFLGGNAISFPYKIPEAQEFLDIFYSDIRGSYRKKAIAELSLFGEEVFLTRATYFDSDGNEQSIGDGGEGDPALADPTAGDPKIQEMVVTNYRDSMNDIGEKVVYRHEGFLAQLEAGRYWVTTYQFFAEFPLSVLPPVELVIVPCD